MNLAQIIVGALLLIAAASAVECTQLFLDGSHYMQVEQYRETAVRLVAYNSCAAENYSISIFSDLPATLSESEFTLGASSYAFHATLSPGGAEPGLYTVHILLESRQDIARQEFVVKVVETENPPLVAEAPAMMKIPENTDFNFAISVSNRGEATLNNLVAFIDEQGQERLYSGELSNLKPGETKHINFHFSPRPRGEYTLNYTVVSGSYSFKGQAVVGSLIKNYPISSIATIRHHEGGYVVDYLVRNMGSKRIEDVFLTAEDLPNDWQAVSPSVFSLSPGESRLVELLLLYGENTDAEIHLALYGDGALLAEDPLSVSQARLAGTGLLSLSDSFEMGLLAILIVLAAYLGITLRKKSKEKNVKLRSLVPEIIGNIWPF